MNYEAVTYKECHTCNEVLPESDFHVNNGSWRQKSCKPCWNNIIKTKNTRRKKQCVSLLGGCCQACGYKKSLEALEFHHLDPSTKKFGIAGKLMYKWDSLFAEVKKCALLCANCHREFHAGLIDLDPLSLQYGRKDSDVLSHTPEILRKKEEERCRRRKI